MRCRVLFLIAAGALALAGCASVPQPLQGEFPPVALNAAREGTAGASAVRWGGQIIETEPREQQTCFFVLAQPLDEQARPSDSASSFGRFVACAPGFYDPAVFSKGRELTVTGTLDGTVQRKIGQYDYTYPKVAASKVYLWPPRPVYTAVPVSPWGPWGPWGGFCDPFWSPWGCGWRPYSW